MLWLAAMSQSSEKSSRQEKRELPRRKQHTIPISITEVATTSSSENDKHMKAGGGGGGGQGTCNRMSRSQLCTISM